MISEESTGAGAGPVVVWERVAVRASGLRKEYGETVALNGVSLEIGAGGRGR
ncbi:hypothetical protein ACIPSA_30160 [Streptomyces sp. NPDC086549]|uniref:hypothetical protein n=1 Tax=Streptomyces sp. NPDC086549 TaxID=3365752 RepID=UPI00380D4700